MATLANRAAFTVSYLHITAETGITLIAAPGAGKLIVIEKVITGYYVTAGAGSNVNVQLYYDVVAVTDQPVICFHGVNQISQYVETDLTGVAYNGLNARSRLHRQLSLGAGDSGLVARGSVENKAVKLTTTGPGLSTSVNYAINVIVFGHVLTLET